MYTYVELVPRRPAPAHAATRSATPLARCRRCACSQSDLACAQPHGAPSGRATVFQNKCSRNAKLKSHGVMLSVQDGVIQYDSGLIGSKMDSSLESA